MQTGGDARKDRDALEVGDPVGQLSKQLEGSEGEGQRAMRHASGPYASLASRNPCRNASPAKHALAVANSPPGSRTCGPRMSMMVCRSAGAGASSVSCAQQAVQAVHGKPLVNPLD